MNCKTWNDNCKLDDCDIVSDVLSCHKTLVKLYADAVIECADPKLREILHTLMTECADDQFDAFKYMSEKGYYETTAADWKQINCCCEKFCDCSANA